jgi:hypothetical protein
MVRRLRQMVFPMLAGGLLVGGGVLMGMWLARGTGSGATWPPEQLLHASTAATGESFAVATGVIDADAEGVFVLDFLTGELQCAVLNHRTGKFSALFKANAARDLGVTKNPGFLMVTGQVNFQRGGGMAQPALSAVYVLDTNSGKMIAYGIPWRRELVATGRPQIDTLVPIDFLQVRNVSIRDQ